MNEKEFNNTFKFSLSQGDVVLCEKIFDADTFNPFTRYSIDVRDVFRQSISKLQKALSRYSYDVTIDVGRLDTTDEDSDHYCYDLYSYYQEMVNKYPNHYRREMRYNPQPIVQQIENKTIRGVECKIGLYINDKPIVERLFYVNDFNPVVRWSTDLVDVTNEITDDIFDKIKKCDVMNMWDDYDLINNRGLTILQIRELSVPKREEMLKRIRK